jgi:hypothetical protein
MYLAEERFCVPGATKEQHEGDSDAGTAARAYAVCMGRQKAAFAARDKSIFNVNRLAADLIALLTQMSVAQPLPGDVERPSALQVAADVLSPAARTYLLSYIEAGNRDKVSIPEAANLLAQGFFRAHGELRAACQLKDTGSAVHHLDLIFDILEEMGYFWRNQNPVVRDANVAAEIDLPVDHPHRRLIEKHRAGAQ